MILHAATETRHSLKEKANYFNNLRYADDTTLMAESEEELSLLSVKESERAGLRLNIKKTKVMASGSMTAWQIEGEKVEVVTFSLLGLQNHCRW